jgi:hypothetical protein
VIIASNDHSRVEMIENRLAEAYSAVAEETAASSVWTNRSLACAVDGNNRADETGSQCSLLRDVKVFWTVSTA